MCSLYQNKVGKNRYVDFKIILLVLIGFVFCPLGDVRAQGDVVLPDLEMNGQVTQNLGAYTLPQDFSFEAEVRIDASDQWRHLVEVGGVEYVWNSPFRLEVGNEGEWYFCIGDGASYGEAYFSGSWRYGAWVKVLFTYVNGVGKFYENGVLLHEAVINKNVAIPGSLIVGSFQGVHRFFQGGIKNGRIVAGELTPGAASAGGGSGNEEARLVFQALQQGQLQLQQGHSIGTLEPFDMRSHTVAFWIRPLGITGQLGSVLRVGNDNEKRYPALFFTPLSSRLLYIQATTANSDDNVPMINQQIPRTWVHVTVVWTDQGNDSQVRLYWNGQLQAEAVMPHPVGASEAMPVYAGDPWNPPASAVLRDVRIYNYALSDQEVINVMNGN